MAKRSIAIGITSAVVLVAASTVSLSCKKEEQKAATAETVADTGAPVAVASSTDGTHGTDGHAIFVERCAVCHGQDADGGRGPTLRGLAGRKAGSARFGYSRALRESTLTWDEATLDRFLASPGQAVPGTTMPIATESAADRKALVSYLIALKGDSVAVASRTPHDAPMIPVAPPGLRTGRDAFGGYRSDGPGVRRRITVADLPAPFLTKSSNNNALVVNPPAGAEPKVPPHFHVTLFAKELQHPRLIRVAPNGDLFVAESDMGQVRVIHPREGNAAAERTEIFAKGLDDPFGIAFYPAGPSPQWVYIAEANAVRRYPYTNGDMASRGAAETLVARLTPSVGGHTMRNLAFSNDGKRMFVAVGSGSNVAEDLPSRTPEEIKAFEATHGFGAAWGAEEWRADVLVFDPNGKNQHVLATGIRNCSGMAVNAKTGEVWCSTNERDALGDDLVPDYVTRVKEGGYYGWPWYYLGDHEDPRHAGKRKDLAGKAILPDVLFQPHSAPLQLSFYEGTMFPPDYRGNAFVALHGSWNRGGRTGYKVARVIVKNGVPTGEYEDFMTGFVVDDEQVWGRPVGVAVGNDGSLFVSDDGNDTIWRVTYK